MKRSMAACGSTGAALFCAEDSIRCLYLSGRVSGSQVGGTLRYWPVNGGDNFSSRARSARTAAIFPPADVPPTMNPVEGSAPNLFALAAAHLRMSQASSMDAGNGFSGAKRYSALIQVAPSDWHKFRLDGVSPSGSPMQNPPPWNRMTSGLPDVGGFVGLNNKARFLCPSLKGISSVVSCTPSGGPPKAAFASSKRSTAPARSSKISSNLGGGRFSLAMS